MLKLLRVRNLALLADVEIEFGPGLNLLTGETGAGKSILVDALALAVGARASSDLLRKGAERATVEALFHLRDAAPLRALLEASGLDADPDGGPAASGDLVIRREIVADGSRAFVNGSPAAVGTLRRLGDELVEIHGQHQHQSLLQPRRHLDLLDAFADVGEGVAAVAAAHAALAALLERRREVRDGRARLADRIEYLRFRLAEFDAVAPQPGEDEALRRERSRLAHAAEIASLSEEARTLLSEGGEASLLGLTARLDAVLRELAAFDPDLGPAREELEEARVRLDDLAAVLRSRAGGVEAEPERLEAVEDRLGALAGLARRFGGSLEAAGEFAAEARRELAALDAEAADPEALDRRVTDAGAAFAAGAADLSAQRRRAVRRLEKAVEAELADLAMEGTRFQAALEREEAADSPVRLDGRPLRYDARGVDRMEFRIAPNRGEDLLPLARIASGGELSRLCLALECALRTAAAGAPCLVFDEVDAGIGGRVAAAVGDKLHRLARERQVLCVTHLPQIASRADQHFRIVKEVERGRTITRVTRLDGPGRIQEVARMLGGKQVTPVTLRHAEEMLGRGR